MPGQRYQSEVLTEWLNELFDSLVREKKWKSHTQIHRALGITTKARQYARGSDIPRQHQLEWFAFRLKIVIPPEIMACAPKVGQRVFTMEMRAAQEEYTALTGEVFRLAPSGFRSRGIRHEPDPLTVEDWLDWFLSMDIEGRRQFLQLIWNDDVLPMLVELPKPDKCKLIKELFDSLEKQLKDQVYLALQRELFGLE